MCEMVETYVKSKMSQNYFIKFRGKDTWFLMELIWGTKHSLYIVNFVKSRFLILRFECISCQTLSGVGEKRQQD